MCAQMTLVQVPVVATGMRYRGGGTPTGNVQFGIYDVNGNILGSTPQTAALTGDNTVNFSSNIQIATIGQYYLAMWTSLGADNFFRLAGFDKLLPALELSAAQPSGLPASFNPVSGISASPHCPAILAIIQGGMP
jgi:hypothetical protein